jgi:hypothetical protein
MPIENSVRRDPTCAPARETDHLQSRTPDRVLEAVGEKLVDVADPLKLRTASADLIRRHPGPSLLIGAAVGFLLARTIRR